MKKVFEKIVEGILTCSGYITSITILLIVAFLFTEAFGLFNNKVIEDGYVLVLNKENEIRKLSSKEIKDIFDEEIVNWREVGRKEDLSMLILKSKYQEAMQSVEEKKIERFRDVIDEYYSFINDFPDGANAKEAKKIFNVASKYVKD